MKIQLIHEWEWELNLKKNVNEWELDLQSLLNFINEWELSWFLDQLLISAIYEWRIQKNLPHGDLLTLQITGR